MNEGTELYGIDVDPFIIENPPKPFYGDIGQFCRNLFKGNYMANNGYTFETGNKIIKDGNAELVSFGSLFVSNADLVEKWQAGKKLNDVENVKDKSKIGVYFFLPGLLGYIDLSVYEPTD